MDVCRMVCWVDLEGVGGTTWKKPKDTSASLLRGDHGSGEDTMYCSAGTEKRYRVDR